MKLLLLKALFFIPLMLTGNLAAQNLYMLNLSDTSTYTTTCGSVNAAQWTVRENFCELTTKRFYYPGNPLIDLPMIAPVSVTISSTGNMGCTEIFPEGAFIRYSINEGPWILHRAITGCEFLMSTIAKTNFNLYAPAGASIRIKISLVTVSNTAKVKLQNGDITVGPAIEATPANWTKRVAASYAKEEPFGVKIYPNPSNGQDIRLKISFGKNEKAQVNLVDLAGNEVYSATFIRQGGNHATFIEPSRPLSPGAYILTGSTEDAVQKQMLIVQ
jgi:hypothetical protein